MKRERLCGIYSITNIANGKRIIGQSRNIKHRWSTHKCELRNNRHHNHHLQSAWNKYGEQNFRLEIILLCTIEELNPEEIRLIKELNTMDRNYGYNLTEGGNCAMLSEESRRKISIALMGIKRGPCSEETRKRMSIAQRGIPKPKTAEHRQKLREAELGKYIPEETRKRMSISQRLRAPPSEETREKTRRTLTGTHRTSATKQKLRIAQLGKHHSDATKKKMSESHKKRFLESQISILA